MVMKRYLYTDFAERIFGVIEDDDSILLLAKTEADADYIRDEVSRWVTNKSS